MVFTTTTFFKSMPCPAGDQCKLTNCIFGHEPALQAAETAATPAATLTPTTNPEKPPSGSNGATDGDRTQPQASSDRLTEPVAKRRRVTYETLADKPLSRAEKIKEDLEAERFRKSESKSSPLSSSIEAAAAPEATKVHAPTSLSRPVSPPPRAGAKPIPKEANTNDSPSTPLGELKKASPEKKESLNPRMLPNAPESHAKRAVFIQHLHKDMVRLNEELKSSTQQIQNVPPGRLQMYALSDQEVIKLALDEEEKAARQQPKVYPNVIKNRIAAYRKMKVEAFLSIVKDSFFNNAPKPQAKKEGRTIITDLTSAQEVQVAQLLVISDQSKLAEYGYIPVPPTAAEAEEAAKAVEMSMNYEECSRCGTRFRVFPDRNEEGKLTTNGPCKHHPSRRIFPPKQKTDHYTGGNQPYYPCCMEQVGAPGCTSSDDHVFKPTSPARLAAVLPFITTPDNPNPAKDRNGRVPGAVGFDCEMAHTAFGLELIRLTAVSWPDHEPLLDVLVRPLGTIIDLNSRFSGVWPEHFAAAIPHAAWDPAAARAGALPVVDSPADARALLCAYLTPSTPLVGHAIENDLNATRLCHPAVVDTILLFPHPRGLPFRNGLKALAKKHLERDVQAGGDRGHDSLEDAVATGDLLRLKVAWKWRDMKAKGWVFEDEVLKAPVGGLGGGGKTVGGLDGADDGDEEGDGVDSSAEFWEE